MTEPTPATQSTKSQSGIDIQDALDILNTRMQDKEHQKSACACHGNHAKDMGQTIDLLASNNNNKEEAETDVKKKDNSKIQNELKKMSRRELLQVVLTTQQDRVATYRQFEQGFQQVLETRSLVPYPSHVAAATASFATQSSLIKSVMELFRGNNEKHLLQSLQRYEETKLNVTAALHLEILRREGLLEPQQESSMRLLEQSVQSLQKQQSECVDAINEVLEEIRYAMLDEE